MRRSSWLTVTMFTVSAAMPDTAIAGPPYVTDDPEPTEFRDYEIYLFAQGTATVDGTGGSAGLDINYGAASDLQLTAVFPIKYEGSTAGLANIEIAAKYRFRHQTQIGWDVAVFPRLFLPSASTNVGERHGSILIPVWVEKDWGTWSTFGGGGCALHHGGDSQNYCIAGWVLARQISPNLQIGGELVYQTSSIRWVGASASLGAGLPMT
jgi:hypothetical protein